MGRFEPADGSTIFLDEIDALLLELQAKLLRVLESGEFERVGSPGPVLDLDVPKVPQSGTDQWGTLKEVEKQRIIEALNATGWQVSGKDFRYQFKDA